ncbi:hypothetical protein TRICI_006662 [Trichomonascus ciferrii]|uniref:C2H2-type domain-containing protein n=1 Tax=Trichomonascus ciferrii TaxID=44093 RepID=A0A642UHC3_9ASCO|nr:hypothetical protein TRICI_006662 [Trichomonascus ciferrii]
MSNSNWRNEDTLYRTPNNNNSSSNSSRSVSANYHGSSSSSSSQSLSQSISHAHPQAHIVHQHQHHNAMFAPPMYQQQQYTSQQQQQAAFQHFYAPGPPPGPPPAAPQFQPQQQQQMPALQLDTQTEHFYGGVPGPAPAPPVTTAEDMAEAILTSSFESAGPLSATNSNSYYLSHDESCYRLPNLFQTPLSTTMSNPLLDSHTHSSPGSEVDGISSPQSIASTPNMSSFSAAAAAPASSAPQFSTDFLAPAYPPQPQPPQQPQQATTMAMQQQPSSSATPPSSSASTTSSSTAAPKRKYTCKICGKQFMRDLPRHMRTHEEVARFSCPFPRSYCPHKRGQFNRPYDFKKHLLHGHFIFDDKSAKSYKDLKSKLSSHGTCASCGVRYRADDWINYHILGSDQSIKCPLLGYSNSN